MPDEQTVKNLMYVGAVVDLVSVPLYVLEIVVILRQRKFWTPFFALFVIRALIDLARTFISYFVYRNMRLALFLPFYRLLPNDVWHIIFFLVGYLNQCANLSSLLMFMNRFAMVTFPLLRNRYPKALALLIFCIIFLVPLPFTVEFLTIRRRLLVTDAEHFQLQTIPPTAVVNLASDHLKAVSAVVFLIASLIVNMMTLFVYNRRRMMMNINNNNNSNTNVNMKLTVYAIVIFVSQSLQLCYHIIKEYVNLDYEMSQTLFAHDPWSIDFSTLTVSAYLMLWASDQIRTEIRKMIMPPWWKESPTSVDGIVWSR